MKKLGTLLILILLLSACNSVKRVKDNELLLTKNTVVINGKKTSKTEVNELIVQKPNNKTLGIPLSLYFYNIGNENKPKTPAEWGKKKPKTYNFIKSIFSEKQSIAFANSMIGLNNWFLRNGQAPVIIDDRKTRKTEQTLSAYYKTQGYFKVKVRSEKDTLGNKKGNLNYFIETGNPTFLDTITTQIRSAVLDSLYNTEKSLSFLKSGDQFKDENFIKEAARVTKLFRNHGIYHFSENLLGFYDLDSVNPNYKTNVKLVISGDRIVEKNGQYISKPLKIQKLRNITVYTDYSFSKRNDPINDSIKLRRVEFKGLRKTSLQPQTTVRIYLFKTG